MKIKDAFTPHIANVCVVPKLNKEITRQCAICRKDILVKVFDGGNYFCEVEHAESYRETGKTMDFGKGIKARITEPVGKIENGNIGNAINVIKVCEEK